MKIYAIKDLKLGFEPPFCRANNELAIRDFQSAFKFGPEPNRFKQFPADYELWCLGEFDQNNGIITSKIEFVSNLLPLNLVADLGGNDA